MDDYLSNEELVDLARHCPDLFGPDDPITLEPITGETGSAEGYVNQVVRLRNQATGVTAIAKHALPYVRRAPEISQGLVLPASRNRLEAELFEMWNVFTPGSAPRVHHCDPDRAVFISDDMARMSLVRFEFGRLHRYPQFGRQIGAFLARNAFYTSDWFLSARDKARLQRAYTKPDVTQLFERVYFDRPLFGAGEPRPAALTDLLADPRLLDEFTDLRHLFLNRQESLAHNDFHTSNVFVGPDSFAVIDGESAIYAPISYDLGVLIGNLMLSCVSLQLRPGVTDAQRISFEDHLIVTVVDALDSYEATFRDLWSTQSRPELRGSRRYLDQLMDRVFAEVCGFAATQALATASIPDVAMELRTLPEGPTRDQAMRLLAFTAVQVLLQRHKLESHAELGELFKAIKTSWRRVRGPLG